MISFLTLAFGFIDFIIVSGISQGVFLAITIQIIQNKNKNANKVLSLILLIASILLMAKFLYSFDAEYELFFRVSFFLDTFIFIFGPLLYIYCRRLVFNETPVYRGRFVYFVLVAIMCIYYTWTLTYSHDELILMWQEGKLTTLFLLIETFGIAFNFYFCYRCYKLIKIYQEEEKKTLSYSQNIVFFLKAMVITISLFFTGWLCCYIMFYFLNVYSKFINYNLIWIVFSIFIYVIGFYSLKQPDIFRIPLSKNKALKSKERLEGAKLKHVKQGLERLMIEEKIYLDHKLTLIDLAKKLDTSANDISWFLNNVYKCNFYDYINQYRIQAFVEKIKNGEHHNTTLLALSFDSGFNSKSTFNKAFKSKMNDTPSNYIKKTHFV